MTRRRFELAVSGAGIAGLTAALALSKADHSVTVYERAAMLTDIGAGIQLSPNAVRILTRLGLLEAIRAIAHEPTMMCLYDARQPGPLTRLPFQTEMTRLFGAPYLVVHRGDLQAVLLEACRATPEIQLRLGQEVSTAMQTPDAVLMTISNDSTMETKCDALVVADGLRSALRGEIDPGVRIVTDEQTAWRATLPLDAFNSLAAPAFAAGSIHLFMGRGSHLVMYRMGKRDIINMVYVANNSAPPPPGGLDDWHASIKAVLAHVADWVRWPLNRVAAKTFAHGRMVMIGDAAHAMTPHAAQGGAMAIEDAAALAQCLSTHTAGEPVQQMLKTYQALRQRRLARVAELSTANREIYQARNIVALGRNMALRTAPPHVLLQRLAWLYSGG
jgi:salicylate hydroxylase